jgi:hypothetical protein
VDLPEDGSDSTFDGRDGKGDGTDDNSVVNAPKRVSAVPASAQSTSCDDDNSTFTQETKDMVLSVNHESVNHTATATPPLRLQQPALKPSIFPSDSFVCLFIH